MPASPINIREWGKRVAALIGLARIEMVSAREIDAASSQCAHPRARQQQLLLSASKHASASAKLEEACALMREIVGSDHG